MEATYKPDMLELFKKEVAGKRIYLLFFSASMHYSAPVLNVEITIEAFEAMLKAHKAKSFDAEIGMCVTIENIKV